MSILWLDAGGDGDTCEKSSMSARWGHRISTWWRGKIERRRLLTSGTRLDVWRHLTKAPVIRKAPSSTRA